MSRDIILARRKREQQFEQEHDTFQAVLVGVDYTSSPNVARQPGFVWFQELIPGDPSPGIAFNRKVPALVGLRVTVKRWPKRPFDYEVIDWDPDQAKNLSSFSGTPLLVQHGRDHEPGGYDPINVYQEMLVPLRTDPGGGLTVDVALYRYTLSGSSVVFGGHNGYSLAGQVPAAGLARVVLIYLDTVTNALAIVAGDTTVDLDTVRPTKPDVPSGGIASSYVRLAGGQTEIERTDIEPAREWLSITGQKGWPYTTQILTVDPGGDADYTTITTAIAAASSGDTILVGIGTYTCDDETLPSGVNLIGLDRDGTILQTSTEARTLSLGGNNYVSNFTISNEGNSASQLTALRINTDGNVVNNCKFIYGNSNAGGGADAVGVYNDSSSNHTNRVENCEFEEGSIGNGTLRAILASSALTPILFVSKCHMPATDEALSIGSNAIIIADATIVSGDLSAATANGLRTAVWDYDAQTFVLRGSQSKIQIQEITTPGTNPPTGSWYLYIKSDGIVYLKDDGGTETSVGSGGWPDSGKAMINSTEYASIAAAISAASAGDIIKVGQGTFTEALTVNKSVKIIGLGPEKTKITNSTDAHTIAVTTTGVILENLEIENTTTGNAKACLSVGSTTGSIVRNCVLTRTGAAVNSFGYYFAGTGHQLIEVDISVSGGTNNYAVRNDTATGAVEIIRNNVDGADYDLYSDQNGTTFTLRNTQLIGGGNNSITGNSTTLTVRGGLISEAVTVASGSPTVAFHETPTITGSVPTSWNGAYYDPTNDTIVHSDAGIRAPANDIWNKGANWSDSDFVALIDSLPGGAAVRYDTPTSGDENILVPASTSQIAKMVLHNTTRGDDALISDCDTTGGAGYAGEITLTAAVPGTWQAGDVITIRSQTNTSTVSGAYFIDMEFTSGMNGNESGFFSAWALRDTGGQARFVLHPYEANNAAKRRSLWNPTNERVESLMGPIEIISDRFCMALKATGSGTVDSFAGQLTKVEY